MLASVGCRRALPFTVARAIPRRRRARQPGAGLSRVCSTATRRCRRTPRSGGGAALVPARVGRRRRDVGGVLVRRRRAARGGDVRAAARARSPGTTSTAAARRAPPSGAPDGDPTARARGGARRVAAGRRRRGCRGSGAARSAGSRYDCVRAFEDLPARAQPRARGCPPLCYGHHRHAADLRQPAPDAEGRRRRRTSRGPSDAEARVRPRVRAHRRDRRRRCARRAGRCPRSSRRARRARVADAPPSSFTHARLRSAAVERVKEYILAGDVVPGRAVAALRRAPRAGARPFDVYRALRVINPSPYMFHLELPRRRSVTGASPEMLVRVDGDGRVEVRAPDRRHAAARRDARRGRRASRPSCSPIRRSAPST